MENGNPAIWTRFVLALLVCLIGMTACGKPEGIVLGKSPDGQVHGVLAVLAGDTPSTVVVRGTLVEKCPVAGCWFRIVDGTSVIRVDTKTAGIVVTDIPLETEVTVAGRVSYQGNETFLDATGLRY